MGRRPRLALASAVLASALGCAEEGDPSESTPRPTPSHQSPSPSPSPSERQTYDAALHDELVAMLEADQESRSGGLIGEGDGGRTARLKTIIEEHGWPTISLVGEDGEDAAWTIAQHSDLDPDFQAEALELLRTAVADGEASPGNLAYLEDRVAVAAGEPQTYGTQVDCGPRGPRPRTPIADRAEVDERRVAADLEPLADYLDEMSGICGGRAG